MERNKSQSCVEHRLDSVKINVQSGSSVSVVLASAGYPGSYETGKPITIGSVPSGKFISPSHSTPPRCFLTSLTSSEFLLGVQVFHAGTKTGDKKEILTAGGRVLVVAAYAADLKQALALAYEAIEAIEFEGKTFRRDIAHRYCLLVTLITSSIISITDLNLLSSIRS